MAQAHAPGPWHIMRDYRDAVFVVGPSDQRGYSPRIAWLRDKHDATARLIAAAPDLLEALQFYADRFAIDPAGDIARAAIAKAKGGAE